MTGTAPVLLFPMSNGPAPSPPSPSRPPIAPLLIGPGITALAILVLLIVARFYEHLPLQPPACGLRTATGLPCVACGGTRSMIALAHGDFPAALGFNPLVFLGVLAAAAWLATSLVRLRFFPDRPSRPRRLPIWLIVSGLVTLFAANWLYLWRCLPD